MRKIGLLTALLICLGGKALGQGVTGNTTNTQSEFPKFSPNVIPPSPDAFAFTKYGDLQIGLNTGTAQFSLPIYTIQSGSLSHNIGLSYSTNGVKVDAMASRVGIDWVLRAGGVITRNILDKPDDDPGMPRMFHSGPTRDGDTAWSFFNNYVKNASYASKPDYQPDEYTYSMDGYSAKFIQRANGEYTSLKKDGVKIEKINGNFKLTSPDGVEYFFDLKDSTKSVTLPETPVLEAWVPDYEHTAWHLTKILSATKKDSIIFNYTKLAIGDTIKYINGVSQDYSFVDDKIRYVLGNTSYEVYAFFKTQNSGIGTPNPYLFDPYFEWSCGANTPVPAMSTKIQQSYSHPYYLSSIDFNLGRVEFKYSDRLDVNKEIKLDSIKVLNATDNSLIKAYFLKHKYSEATNPAYTNICGSYTELKKRLFLDSVYELSNDLSQKTTHAFEYDDINSLPPRLSYAQDKFGYFNGKVNTYFFPNDTWADFYLGNNAFGGDRTYSFRHAKKGALKKITYPTGGYTMFEYEPHKAGENYAYKYIKDSVACLMDTSTAQGQETFSPSFYYDGQKQYRIYGNVSWASVPIDVTNGGTMTWDFIELYGVIVNIVDAATNTQATSSTAILRPGFSIPNLLSGLPVGTYKIKIKANRPHMKARVVIQSSEKINDNSDTAGIAGIRVKSIADFDQHFVESNRKEFIYGEWNGTSNSGTGLNNDPSGGDMISMTRLLGTVPIGDNSTSQMHCGYNTLHSSSVSTTYLTDDNTVFYNKVIELNYSSNNTNRGGIEYEFYDDYMKYPIPLRFEWMDYQYRFSPVVPVGASKPNGNIRSGLQKSSKVFTFGFKGGTRNILQETYNYYSVDTPSLVIDTFFVVKQVLKRDSYSLSWPRYSDYDIYKYWRYYSFVKLDSTVTHTYANSETLTNKTSFLYSIYNYRPTQVETTGSDGNINKLLRKYVSTISTLHPDYLSVYQPMIISNKVNTLLEEFTYKNTDIIAKKKMDYANFGTPAMGLPTMSYSSFNNTPDVMDVDFESYDSKLNLEQFTGRDGVTNSIIYGYNKTYPVAKIVGKNIGDAVTLSGIDLNVINNPATTDAAMRTELNKLRTLSNCLVSTITYKPLVGVTSETDANGKTVYYEYDVFNRLKLIRDKDNNIIKKFCYNYQGQQTDCTESISLPALPPCTPCTGVDKKCINDVCETGIKWYTATVQTGPNTWECTYYYKWSDNSISQTYTETSPTMCWILEEM